MFIHTRPTRLTAGALLVVLGSIAVPSSAQGPDEKNPLLGKWRIVSSICEGKRNPEVENGKCTLTFKDGAPADWEEGWNELVVDLGESPWAWGYKVKSMNIKNKHGTIDVEFGLGNALGAVSLTGIYEIDPAGQLKICLGRADDPPTRFSATKKTEHWLLNLERCDK